MQRTLKPLARLLLLKFALPLLMFKLRPFDPLADQLHKLALEPTLLSVPFVRLRLPATGNFKNKHF